MLKNNLRLTLAIASILVLTAVARGSSGNGVSVEANVLVSHDLDMGHTESDLAVNPLNPRNLVGGTTVMGKINGPVDMAYTSLDGGYTWSNTTPYEARQQGTGDPRVVFTNRGTALFISMYEAKYAMEIYRSTDGGIHWQGPAMFPIFDHEMVAVDRSHGPYANRIYIAGEGERPNPHPPARLRGVSQMWLYTSDDDGRTFARHSMVETGIDGGPSSPFYKGGVGVRGLEVLSDGTVALSFSRYALVKPRNFHRYLFTKSSDGGRTFSPTVKIADVVYGNHHQRDTISTQQERNGNVSGDNAMVMLTADHSSGPYRDRLYTVWQRDGLSATPRIVYSVSADRGKTWSKPKAVGSIDPNEAQFQPMVGTNNRGAVAVTWYSTAGFPDKKRFNAYVAISADGGRSFSSPARVSSQSSLPMENGNFIPVPLVYNAATARAPGFISAYSRWPNGGDYVGLAAGSDGVFHLYWPDSRGTEYQMYSTRIHPSAGMTAPASANEGDVTNDIVLALDPVQVNRTTGEVDIPVRLHNISTHTLYGPVSVKFLGAQSSEGKKYGQIAPGVKVLNATRGGSGYGATFDYSNAFGSYGALPPGGVSEAVLWRFHLSDLVDLSGIALNVNVTARSM